RYGETAVGYLPPSAAPPPTRDFGRPWQGARVMDHLVSKPRRLRDNPSAGAVVVCRLKAGNLRSGPLERPCAAPAPSRSKPEINRRYLRLDPRALRVLAQQYLRAADDNHGPV